MWMGVLHLYVESFLAVSALFEPSMSLTLSLAKLNRGSVRARVLHTLLVVEVAIVGLAAGFQTLIIFTTEIDTLMLCYTLSVGCYIAAFALLLPLLLR